jgi:anti-sigma-K factor RskA
MMDHDELLELAEVLALGGLSAEERARVEEHVADGCERCAAALRANLDVADQLLLAVGPVAPSPETRERLFTRVRATGPRALVRLVRRPPRGSRALWLGASAAALAFVGLGVLSAALGMRLARERSDRAELEEALAYEEEITRSLQNEIDTERAQRVALQQRMEGMSRIVAAIEAPLVRTLALAGQGDFQRALARAYIDPESGRLILYAHNLPPVPDGRTYQLWVIVEDRPTSVGVFRSDSQGEAKYDAGRIPDLGGPVTVAVTLEPDGGVPKPTGPIVLAGS